MSYEELPEHVRIAFFGIDGQHAEFDEFVWLNAADPEGADDLALGIFFEVDLPARLELEIIDVQARREVAFHADRRGLAFVGNAHGVLLSCAKGRLHGINPDVAENDRGREQG